MKGFKVALQPAVPGLTAADLVVLNAKGNPALLTAVSTSDSGATYNLTGYLKGGDGSYLSLVKSGYDFRG